MTVQIKTIDFEPKRQSFGHVARRIGGDKPATRYQEATLDVQATENFHYKPLWEPEYWHYDTGKTEVVIVGLVQAARPPAILLRHLQHRARRAAAVRRGATSSFVEERDLLAALIRSGAAPCSSYLIPLRHVEWGANMNCQTIADRCYGAQIAAPAAFAGTDRLGMAQALTRIGLLLDPTASAFDEGRRQWPRRRSGRGCGGSWKTRGSCATGSRCW